jgi:Gpi18-like mannosyltransferase
LTSLDYPPFYLYPLYVVGRLIEIDTIGGYPSFRMLAIKFVPCLTDSLTCIILYKLGSHRSKALGLFAAGIWAVNPASIFNCGFWGQTDCVMMFLAALLFYLLGQKKVVLSGVVFALLCTTKLQGLYLAPVLGMELFTICFGSLNIRNFHLNSLNRVNVGKFLKFVCAAAITIGAVFVPFMIGSGSIALPLSVYTGGLDKYPYCSVNADNFYAFIGLNGVKDSVNSPLGISVSTVGTMMLALAVTLVVVVYLFGMRKSHWLAAYMLTEFIFILTCRQHERYQIITLIMLAGAFLEIADRRILPMFYLQSFVVFVNQARVLGYVHDKDAPWCQYISTMRDINSLINVILFAVSIVFVLRYYFDKKYQYSLLSRVTEWLNKNAALR